MKFKLALCSVLSVCLICAEGAATQAVGREAPVGALKAEPLKVVTFNTWLLDLMGFGLASNVPIRRELIARTLRSTHADIVNLIEVWREESANDLVARLKDVYPYCSFNPDNIRFGSLYANGLLVLSKFPLKTNGIYYANGCTRPLDALIFSETSRFDENFVSKGAIHNVVLHPSYGPLDLFSSHLGALSFSDETNDYDESHKQTVFDQSVELMRFMNRVSVTPTQFLAIDTNRHFRLWQAHKGESSRLDPSYLMFRGFGFHDSFMDANRFDPQTLTGIYSFDIAHNPNASEGAFGGAPSDFIDYIFVRSKRLRPAASRLMFTTAKASLNGKPLFLSDHYAVGSVFVATP